MIKVAIAIQAEYLRNAQYYFGADTDSALESDEWVDVEGDLVVGSSTFDSEEQLQSYLEVKAKNYHIPVGRFTLYRMWEKDI